MPSEKILSQKQQYVADLAEKLQNSAAGVLVEYKGINVADDTKLRKELREAGVEYTVVKNTMLKLAAEKAGLDGLTDVLKNTTALAVSTDDQIAPAKILGKYAEDHGDDGFAIKAGFMDGEILDADKVVALGKLPSKEQLIGQLVGLLVAPMRGLAVALNAIAEKSEQPEA